ncbi:MAG: hypothetical protein ABIZ64_02270 [Casimicrobium sp.]
MRPRPPGPPVNVWRLHDQITPLNRLRRRLQAQRRRYGADRHRAPGTTSAFGISVAGLADRNIRWVATVRATEVSSQ